MAAYRIELGPRRFRYAGHSWHQYVHVVELAPPRAEPAQPARGLAAAMAQNASDDSRWLQERYGFGFRSAGGRTAKTVAAEPAYAHAHAGVDGCEACAVALAILRAPLAT
ncbi:hypothetical protein KFE25_002256 [Diacronema lutheri]|uniref:Uncharacterized protein n=1 Tax=Diacronema lutheri TaxID=2081491 RepID=A0A8J5XRC2_DIALT|nr:hypothetical protein KFE25_002256 [Diacronema lutheri]